MPENAADRFLLQMKKVEFTAELPVVAPFGFRRWAANPSLCRICARGLDQGVGGTEIEATFLFADIRGSTAIAERTAPAAYHALLERFLGGG